MSWFSWRKSHRWLGVAAGCVLGAASAFADDPTPTPRKTTELYGGAPLAKPEDESVREAAEAVVNSTPLSGAVPAQATSPADMPTMSDSQANRGGREMVYPNGGRFFFANNRLMRRQDPEPQQPLAPAETPQQQIIPVSTTIAGELDLNFDNVSTARAAPPTGGVSEAVSGGSQPLFRNTKDAGTLLLDSPTASNVSLFRRPSASDPHIRGFHQRQIYTQMNGGQWVAARWDLDTIVSKIDSGVVDDVIVIKGPYSAVYGPNFSFIDVVTVPTPRYCCPDYEARSIFNFEENGNGLYGRQVIEGGSHNWGFRMNAGFRTANDYRSGNGTQIRGSFKHRDIDFALGYDFSPDDRLEFNYVRLDLTDAEFYNQPTDIDFLVTNGFTLRYEQDYMPLYDHAVSEVWYNRTRVAQSGINRLIGFINPDPVLFPGFDPIPVISSAATYADQISYGSRTAITWGDKECSHMTVGGDYRYVEQELLEASQMFTLPTAQVPGTNIFPGNGTPNPPPIAPGRFDIPKSNLEDYGVFSQATDHIGPWTVTTGGRVDFVDIDSDPYRFNPGNPDPADREFTLWSAFAVAEYQLNCEWSLLFGGGHAERAPSFTELYADQPFLAGNQNGFNFIQGNDQLNKESLWQVDAGIVADYSNMSFALRGFYGWVDDYITLTNPGFIGIGGINISPGFDLANTDAILAGFDVNSEYDLGGGLTVFGNMSYTEGRDTNINAPLFGIYPFQSRLGIRAETGRADCRGMGIEFSSRIVDNQDRLGIAASPNPMNNLQELATPGFTTFDLRGYWRVNPNLLLTSGVLNLTDKNYFEHFDFRRTQVEGTPSFQPGRSFYMGGELTY